MAEAEAMRRDMVERTARGDTAERRFSVRVAAAPGAVEVHWKNSDGSKGVGRGLDISMNGVLFEADGFGAGSIEKIVFPRQKRQVGVKKADVQRRDGGKAAAVLHGFANNIDDRIAWIELLTRVKEDV